MPTEFKKPTDIKSLKAIVEGAVASGAKFKAKIIALREVQAGQKVKLVDSILEQLGPQERIGMAPALNKVYSDWNRTFLKENDAARYTELQWLTAALEALSYARDTLSNPIKLASIYGLGTEARSRISAEIQGAGPATLRTLAETAELTGDMALAAALIAENDKRNRPDRGFVSQELAAKVWAEPVAQAKQLCEAMDIEHRKAIKLNRFIEGKPGTAFELLEEGLTFGEAGLSEKKEAPEKKPMSNQEKILNGLPFKLFDDAT